MTQPDPSDPKTYKSPVTGETKRVYPTESVGLIGVKDTQVVNALAAEQPTAIMSILNMSNYIPMPPLVLTLDNEAAEAFRKRFTKGGRNDH